jgi:hypothetical protein
LDPQSLQVSLPAHTAALADASGEAKGHSRETTVVTFESFKRGAELRAVFKAALVADSRWRRRRKQNPQDAATQAMEVLACWVNLQPLEQARELVRSSHVDGQ